MTISDHGIQASSSLGKQRNLTFREAGAEVGDESDVRRTVMQLKATQKQETEN